MKILVSYFSATGGAARIAGVIIDRLKELGAQVEIHDATTPEAREFKPDFSRYDAAVFGAPIHYARAPRVFRNWLGGLDGGYIKCALFFSYGGFQTHPSHHTTRVILEEREFRVAASADFPCKHTYNLAGWRAMADRPNERDIEVARRYAEKIYSRFTGDDPEMVGELDPTSMSLEDLDKLEDNRLFLKPYPPSRGGVECQMCMLCEELCPTGAMNAEKGEVDADKCMFCLACLNACPDQVIKFIDLSSIFEMKMKNDQETQDTLNAKESRMFL